MKLVPLGGKAVCLLHTTSQTQQKAVFLITALGILFSKDFAGKASPRLLSRYNCIHRAYSCLM